MPFKFQKRKLRLEVSSWFLKVIRVHIKFWFSQAWTCSRCFPVLSSLWIFKGNKCQITCLMILFTCKSPWERSVKDDAGTNFKMSLFCFSLGTGRCPLIHWGFCGCWVLHFNSLKCRCLNLFIGMLGFFKTSFPLIKRENFRRKLPSTLIAASFLELI